jgi:anti-sigma-K factor RskA
MPQPETLSPNDRDALAGELALGVLEGEERAQALRLMLSDRDFAARVEQWRAHQGGLFDAMDDVAAPDRVWAGIASRIGADTALPLASTSLRWWRRGAMVSAALAAGLALMLVVPQLSRTPATGPQPMAVAQLTGPIAGLRIATRYDPATATLRVRASGMPATPTEPELWIVTTDGRPVSLGQIDRDGETVIRVAEGHRSLINGNAHFSLSMEPRSPQPSAAPSAPFVADGAIDFI